MSIQESRSALSACLAALSGPPLRIPSNQFTSVSFEAPIFAAPPSWYSSSNVGVSYAMISTPRSASRRAHNPPPAPTSTSGAHSAKKSSAIDVGTLQAWRRLSAAASAPMELRSVISKIPHAAHCESNHAPHCLTLHVYTPGRSISPSLPLCGCSSPALPSISKSAMRSRSAYADASHVGMVSNGHVCAFVAARFATSSSV
mmetsp:Transcript_927/g.3892  ORF Transcript_927/g.3892 Transcript_927/m.3892 type:complete len:201 (+) Transcript_927:300-902(+)